MKITALRYGTTFLGKDQIFSDGDKNDLVRISLLYFLVETENKKILIDVGCDEMKGFNLIEHKRPVDILEEYGVDILDLYQGGIPKPLCDTGDEYTTDGVHPNDNGYRLIAKKICQYLQ